MVFSMKERRMGQKERRKDKGREEEKKEGSKEGGRQNLCFIKNIMAWQMSEFGRRYPDHEILFRTQLMITLHDKRVPNFCLY